MSFPRKTPFIGIYEDLKKRLPLYSSDFEDVFNLKVAASILYMFFTSIGPAITFANLLDEKTDQELGVIEVMFSTAICGIIMSLFAGQPLVIVGVTGPVSILTIAIYQMAQSWGLKFIPFYAWSQIWAAIMLVVQAIWNNCDMVPWITRFSCEIFGFLIALIYIYQGLFAIVGSYSGSTPTESGMFQLVVSVGMLWLSMKLSNARNWVVFNTNVRDVIADYGPSVALIIWTCVVYLPGANDVEIKELQVPSKFETTSGRAWFVDLSDIPVWGVFSAILPGFIICVLFFFDHNVSSLMAQDPEFNLRKPSAFHWDYLVVGICLLVTGILGIPPTNGLIPQAPLHTKSLIKWEVITDSPEDGGDVTEGDSNNNNNTNTNSNNNGPPPAEKFRIVGIHEQRVSNLATSFLIGLMCFRPFLSLIALVPPAALSGLFLFMGVSSFAGNQLAERLCIMVTEPRLRHSSHGFMDINYKELQQFSVLQFCCSLAIFGITFTPAQVVFPVLIGILVPFRLVYLPKYFSQESLECLDPLNDKVDDSDTRNMGDMGGQDMKILVESGEYESYDREGHAATQATRDSEPTKDSAANLIVAPSREEME